MRGRCACNPGNTPKTRRKRQKIRG
ncbi:hypothetical protein, partial [Xanthomonas oryzae]